MTVSVCGCVNSDCVGVSNKAPIWCFDVPMFSRVVGLSHCRHMTKVRHSVAHLVSHTHIIHVDDSFDKGNPLSETEWLNFCELPSSKVSSVGVWGVPSVTA